MQGAEAIREKIIADANAEAESIVNAAKYKAETIIAAGKAAADAHTREQQVIIDGYYEGVIAKKKVATELECKKLRLNEKRRVLDEIFKTALDKLSNMDADKYRRLIKAMLDKHREKGDKVIISAKDKDILKDVCAGAEVSGDFGKGIILEGLSFDKNLTLENEIASMKGELETEIGRLIG